jgi:hypothetical protein
LQWHLLAPSNIRDIYVSPASDRSTEQSTFAIEPGTWHFTTWAEAHNAARRWGSWGGYTHTAIGQDWTSGLTLPIDGRYITAATHNTLSTTSFEQSALTQATTTIELSNSTRKPVRRTGADLLAGIEVRATT